MLLENVLHGNGKEGSGLKAGALQVLRKRIGMSLRRGNDITLVGEQFVWHRMYTYQEVCLLAELTGFNLVETYGDLDTNISVDSPESKSLVLCLQKPEIAGDEDFLDVLSQ